MVRLTSVLISMLSLATVAISTYVQRSGDTFEQIKADIVEISAKFNTLSTNINNFPMTGGSLANALAIHREAESLTISLGKGTIDVVATGILNLVDGTVILTSFQSLSAPIHTTLIKLVDKKATFSGLVVGGILALILQDLEFLKGNTTNLANALIANNEASLSPSGTSLRDTILEFFDTAIAAYSS